MATILEALMPISDREKVRQTVNRAITAFDSLNFFWRDSGRPLILHVVVPDCEHDDLRDAFSSTLARSANLDVHFRRESEISPAFGAIEGRGVAKQMLIKLAAFTFVDSPFYLTLDSDIVACKPFGPTDLIKDGLALNDWEVPSSTSWWQYSAKILGLTAELDRPRMFVTPQILSTDIAKRLAAFLSERMPGVDWMQGLLEVWTGTDPHIWTEYALYDLFAEASGLMAQYHLPRGAGRLQSSETGIWIAEHFANWQPELAISGERPGYFLVLQSITAHGAEFSEVRVRWLDAMARFYPEYRSLTEPENPMNANQSVLLRTAFEDVYAENRWGKGSGPGSSPKNTIFYRAFLEQFMKVNAVRSVTDLGCGDWQLSRFLDWSGIDYIGLDVVPHLVEANTKAFGARGVEFRVLESVDDLPGGDLLLAKEIFQHLPNAMICDYLEAIRNKYRMALITNGIEPSSYCNVDIAIGDVRPLHMHEAPFSVPGAFVFNHSFVVDGVNYQNGTYLMIGQAA